MSCNSTEFADIIIGRGYNNNIKMSCILLHKELLEFDFKSFNINEFKRSVQDIISLKNVLEYRESLKYNARKD